MHLRTPLHRLSLSVGAMALVATLTACGDDASETEAAPADSDLSVSATDTPASDAATSTVADQAGTNSEDTTMADDAMAMYLGDYTLIDEEFGTQVTVTVDGGTRTIVSNSLPNHETGDFPNGGNPNEISEQSLTFEFTTAPSFTGTPTNAQTPGVGLNGVTFEPGTAETATCASGETYRIEALQDLYDLGLDFNNAHVQPGGQYHYHGISSLMVDAFDDDTDLVLVGFAADGHLMYYSKSGAYRSGYELSESERSGTDCLISGPDGIVVDLDGTTPDGTYGADWVYDAEAGDLDECNGVEIDGAYAYVITDEYPFISRCLMGEAQGQPGGGAGGGAPDLSEAAAALGVTADELLAILPAPGNDLTDAAATLGVTVEELEAVLPPPGGQP